MKDLINKLLKTSINLEYFYVVSFAHGQVQLQGDFSPLLVKQLKAMGFDLHVNANTGHLEATHTLNNVKIEVSLT